MSYFNHYFLVFKSFTFYTAYYLINLKKIHLLYILKQYIERETYCI